jgi:hypothetical protein
MGILDQIKEMNNEKLLKLQEELHESICKKLTMKEQLTLNILLEVAYELTQRETS